MNTRASVVAAAVCMAVVLVAAPGCGKKSCLGQVDSDGTTYKPDQPTFDGPQRAQLFACNVYCTDSPRSTCVAQYRAWQKAQAGTPKASLPLRKAIYEDRSLLSCVTDACARGCLRDVAAGTLKGHVSCGED